MPIAILPPAPALPVDSAVGFSDDSDYDSEDGGVDMEGDTAMSSKPESKRLVTPGEVVSDDGQMMRGHGTYVTGESAAIVATVAGTVQKTNKLLSVRPLRARYTPEIGDLVVGRIVEVQSKRWRVDVGSTVLAALPLSAINLPGGILRKRTETDELQIRTFFSEGDLLVAEVQGLFQDGSAGLHTRSLKYGKLRNGVFLQVTGTGGGGGVVRSRRQLWTIEAANGGGRIDVILGVNGFIWIAMHVDAPGEGKDEALTRMEETVSQIAYSSQNEEIPPATRREIGRIRSVITLLVEAGLRVDEDMVNRGYQAAIDVQMQAEMDTDNTTDSIDYLGGERAKMVIAMVTGR